MNKRTLTITTIIAVSLFAGGSAWAEKSSVEMGQKLFNDTSLGGSTNDKSCASCHPGGEGMEKAGTRDDLTKMINRCITGPLAGEKLDGRKVEMRSLKMYIQSLGH